MANRDIPASKISYSWFTPAGDEPTTLSIPQLAKKRQFCSELPGAIFGWWPLGGSEPPPQPAHRAKHSQPRSQFNCWRCPPRLLYWEW
jgi:hypothetical protein